MHAHRQRDAEATDRGSPSGLPKPVDQLLALQRAAGNAAVARLIGPRPIPVQRYAERPGAQPGKRYLVSENGHYAIAAEEADPLRHQVWALTTAGAVSPFLTRVEPHADETILTTPGVYRRHVARANLVVDCLHAAEEIINNATLEEDGDYSVVASTGQPFAADSEAMKNAARTELADIKNEYADPGVGQAFVIVNMSDDPDDAPYPYHAAAVVAADGQDRITLEQTRAAAWNERPGTGLGSTYIYTVGDAANSFHARMRDGAGYAQGMTIVIGPTTALDRSRVRRRSGRQRKSATRHAPY